MINEIINVFERKFNKLADRSNAFTTRFIRDEDSAIGTLCFNKFNVEFEYGLECGGSVEKSGLNIIIDFSKRSAFPIKCMMYDLIGLIDRENFSCWFYCFIESAERMELCFDKLSSDFEKTLPKIKDFAERESNISKIENVLRKNILNTVGIDIFEDINSEFENDDVVNPGDVYEYLFSLYFGFEQCAFASNEYRDFLAGDFKKAQKKYEKKKKRLTYEDLLLEHIKTCENPKPVLSQEYECLKDGLKEYYGANGFIPYFSSCGLLLVPFLAVCVAVYYAVSGLLYHSAIYASPLEPYNAASCLIPAILCSLIAAYFMQENIYRSFFRNKYQKMKNYDAIFNSEKSKKRVKIVLYLVYILALIFLFFNANNGIALYERGVNVSSYYFDFKGDFYNYGDLSCLDITQNGGENDYTLYADGEDGINLGTYADSEDIEKRIVPVFEKNGVEIIRSKTE